MAHIPKEMRVRLRLLYNGYVHKAVGLKTEDQDVNTVKIFADQLPRGWLAERGTDIDLQPDDGEIVPDQSGVDGWEMPEVFDLDSFLRKQKMD